MMKRTVLCLVVLGVCFSARATPIVPVDAVRQHAKQRHDALIQDGFNFTHSSRLAAGEKLPRRLDLIIPEAGEHVLSLWMETLGGEGSIRLLAGDGHPWMELAGRTGELTVTRDVAAGKYMLEIDASKSQGGEVLFGVKGSVVSSCDLDTARVKEIPATASSGFAWPYLLFVPEKVTSQHLLVVPNNTGFSTEAVDLLRASASCQVAREAALASRLGTAMLVPLFPRPKISSSGGLVNASRPMEGRRAPVRRTRDERPLHALSRRWPRSNAGHARGRGEFLLEAQRGP